MARRIGKFWTSEEIHLGYSDWTTFMSRQTAVFDLVLPPRRGRVTASRWLYEALRTEILEGRLQPGARLPASRDLAAQYGLARGTIVSVFEHLAAEGYVEGSAGSGTYVNRVLPEEFLEAGRSAAPQRASHAHPKRRVTAFARAFNPFPEFAARPVRAFRTDLPAVDLFPLSIWTQLTTRRQRRATATMLTGCETMGYRPLREAIADYLATSRGVRCNAEQVAVVSGAQEALDLVARLFVERGDRVCVEEPGYPGAAYAFEAAGAKIVPVPVDDEGIGLRRTQMRGARLVYVTPAHQFPLGATMSLPRRLALLDWARDVGALIFEDDYDGEYRYAGRPVPALQGLDAHGLVLFSGTFSKVMFPSLRLAYLVVPEDLIPYVTNAMALTRRHAAVLEQAVLCDFIAGGHFGRHLRRMRQVYGERLSVLMARAKEHLAGLLDLSPIEAGLQTAGWLAPGHDSERIATAAAERKIEVTPLSRYARRPLTRDGLQLGFAAVDAREIGRGVRELAAICGA
jgi:GntR family transcriptional regulator/MocR family aminotransferase